MLKDKKEMLQKKGNVEEGNVKKQGNADEEEGNAENEKNLE